MRVAFYAPLKPPTHPVPSGDRAMARLLIAALERAGHAPFLLSRLRSFDGAGDPARQARLRMLAIRLAARAARRLEAAPPDLVLTYHPYHKAPDWIGPRVAAAFGVPYVVAEASVAGKRAEGPWALGHAASVAGLREAAAVIGLNPADEDGVRAATGDAARWHFLRPFVETRPFREGDRASARAAIADSCGLDPDIPWLVAVAMMRPGDKLASYRLLASALAEVPEPWALLVAGDGAARPAVETALCAFGPRIRVLGGLDRAGVARLLRAGDLLVWPAVNEAFCIALVEAAAAGLPVVAGAFGGVPAIVRDGATGVLTPPGDVGAFAAAIRRLLGDAGLRARLGGEAARFAAAELDLEPASRRLGAILAGLGR